YGLDIVRINAVFRFNLLTELVVKITEGLLRDAQGVGARALVLCPLNDGTIVRPEVKVEAIKRLSVLWLLYSSQSQR
ncbi:inosose isomerase, partial [Salmonella enterica subsp. enterica serovar Typhimurium]